MTSLRYRWKHQEIERPHIKNSSHKSSCNGGTHPARHTGTDVSDCQIDAYEISSLPILTQFDSTGGRNFRRGPDWDWIVISARPKSAGWCPCSY